MENETGIVLALSIIALVVSIVAIGYVYFDEPQEVDLSVLSTGISGNTFDIVTLQSDVSGLEDDVEGISLPYVSSSDLKDLEEYANWFDNIEKNADDIDDLEDGKTGKAGPEGPQGINGTDGADGAVGLDGETGLPGAVGEQGPAGPRGPAGYGFDMSPKEYLCMKNSPNLGDFKECMGY